MRHKLEKYRQLIFTIFCWDFLTTRPQTIHYTFLTSSLSHFENMHHPPILIQLVLSQISVVQVLQVEAFAQLSCAHL